MAGDADPGPTAPPSDAFAEAMTAVGSAALWEVEWAGGGRRLGRVPLLFWLVETQRPRRIAVVGNNARQDFSAICQAVDRLGLAADVLGAFTMPLPDKPGSGATGESWRRVGACRLVDAEAARELLAGAPVDLLILDRAAAAAGGASAPDLWRAALASPAILVMEAADLKAPAWSAALSGLAGMTVGGAHAAIFAAENEPRTAALQAVLNQGQIAASVRLCLERLGEGLAASHAGRQAEATAEGLEMALAKTAAQSDSTTAQLTAAREEIGRLEQRFRTITPEAVGAADKLAALIAQLAEAEVRAAAEQARSADAEARLALVFGSTSWRLTGPLRAVLGRSPRLARLLRRIVKLAWWTVTFQLPARHRMWRQQILGEVADPGRSAALPPAPPVSADAASAAPLARIELLAGRVAAVEAMMEAERNRTDWMLGTVEGVAARIEDYHAHRETDEYRAAFASAAPLVSICVATMDRAELLLERSIASACAQTYRNLQIVVVGDNCIDDTGTRLAELRDDRIQFVNLPERGPYPLAAMDRWRVAGSNAMNHALSLCEGQFITHLDDDDAIVPHRIETLVAAALDGRADFLWHSFWYENRDGTWTRLGNDRLEMGHVSTGAIFYHRYFARFPWDVYAYRIGEPGDWNRVRKIKMLRPHLRYVDEPLLYHHAERSQAAFVARDGERFLE